MNASPSTRAQREYTVGVYKSPRSGYLGQIVFRRELGAGLTYKAEVARDPEIEATCRNVVESLDVWGPINLQLRKTAAGVRIFEINLRFSSSVVMRSCFGFNEPELALRDEIYLEPGQYAGGEAAFDQGGRRARARTTSDRDLASNAAEPCARARPRQARPQPPNTAPNRTPAWAWAVNRMIFARGAAP